MAFINRFLKGLLLLLVLIGCGWFLIANWSWVFSKRVKGEIIEVERVTSPTAIFGKATEAQIYSYSVLIKGQDGKLYSSSSEDRQWAVAKIGYCVEALLFRYPPWDFKKGNTYFGARLEQLEICPGGAPAKPADTAPVQPDAVPPSGVSESESQATPGQ